MPTDNFEPLPGFPEEGVPLSVLRHSAEWAKTFEPSTAQLARTPTSVALRRRHAGDIQDYAQALEAERVRQQEERAMHDRAAANYLLRSRGLDLKQRLDDYTIQDKIDRQERTAAMLPLELRAKEADAARKDAERSRALEISAQRDNFFTQLAGNRSPTDSPEYHAAVEAAHRAFPRAIQDPSAKAVIDSSLKFNEERRKQQEAQRLFEEGQTRAETKAEELGKVPTHISEKGGVSYGNAPKAATRDSDELKAAKSALSRAQAEYSAAATTWRQKEPDPTTGVRPLEKNVEDLRAARDAAENKVLDLIAGGHERPAHPMEGRTATNSKTGERMIFRDGKWQPLTQ